MKSLLRAMEKHGVDGYEKRWTVAWPQVFGRAEKAIARAKTLGSLADARTITAMVGDFEDEAVGAYDAALEIIAAN